NCTTPILNGVYIAIAAFSLKFFNKSFRIKPVNRNRYFSNYAAMFCQNRLQNHSERTAIDRGRKYHLLGGVCIQNAIPPPINSLDDCQTKPAANKNFNIIIFWKKGPLWTIKKNRHYHTYHRINYRVMHDIESSATCRGKPRTLNSGFDLLLSVMWQGTQHWLRQDN